MDIQAAVERTNAWSDRERVVLRGHWSSTLYWRSARVCQSRPIHQRMWFREIYRAGDPRGYLKPTMES